MIFYNQPWSPDTFWLHPETLALDVFKCKKTIFIQDSFPTFLSLPFQNILSPLLQV